MIESVISMTLMFIFMRFVWYPIRSARDIGAEKAQNEHLSKTIETQREVIHELQQLLEPQ